MQQIEKNPSLGHHAQCFLALSRFLLLPFSRYFFLPLSLLISLFMILAITLLLSTPLFATPVERASSLKIESIKNEYYYPGRKMDRIRDQELLNSDQLEAIDLLLKVKSQIIMSDEQEQMLLNGIPLTFVYDIRLEKRGFFTQQRYQKEVRYLLFYHGLSKQFVVRDLETKKQHSYPILSLALLSISTPVEIIISMKSSEGIDLAAYVGRAKLWLDIEALPTPLRIPAYLSSNWWLSSDWFQWELIK